MELLETQKLFFIKTLKQFCLLYKYWFKVQIASNQATSFNSKFERHYATIIRMVSFESDKNEGSQIKSKKKDAQQNFCSKCSQLSSSMDLPNANKQKQMFCE